MLRYSVSQDFNPGTVRTACLCPSWWSHLKARSLRIRGWMLAVGPEVHWGCQPDPSMWLGLLHSLVAGCQGGASGNKTRATWPLYPPSQAASLPPHFLDWGSYEGPPGFKELNTDISIAMSLPCPSSTLEEEHKGWDISPRGDHLWRVQSPATLAQCSLIYFHRQAKEILAFNNQTVP